MTTESDKKLAAAMLRGAPQIQEFKHGFLLFYPVYKKPCGCAIGAAAVGLGYPIPKKKIDNPDHEDIFDYIRRAVPGVTFARIGTISRCHVSGVPTKEIAKRLKTGKPLKRNKDGNL